MNRRTRAILELVRIPNVFTAPADSLAGFLYAGGAVADVAQWPLLAAVSAFLYAGGMALNDAADARRDAGERPRRPIPSGRIARHRAAALGILCLSLGMALSIPLGPRAASVALALCGAVLAYDVVFKRTALAAALMGACRGLNMALGLAAAGAAFSGANAAPVTSLWLYVTSVTVFARTESRVSSRSRLTAGAGGILAGIVGLLAMPLFRTSVHAEYAVFAAFLLAATAPGLWRAMVTRRPADVQRAVRMLVLGLIVFDAAVAAAAGGWRHGFFVSLLLAPTLWLARRFRST